jgi:hypothetical protein
MQDIVDVRCGQSPLGLATVAALTPRDIPVELQDENAEPISLDTWWRSDAGTCSTNDGRKSWPESSGAAGSWSS